MENKEFNIETDDASRWVDEYADGLYSYAIARINDHDLALDLVQDTFAAGIKSLKNFEGKSTIKTWLYSILKRKIIDHWRKEDVRKTRPMSSYFSESGINKGGFLPASQPKGIIPDFEQKLEDQELMSTILGCIEDLPGKQKGIVLDKLVEEKESEEVCKDYEITPSNLWVIIHRAKLHLRECIENKWLKA